MAALRPHSLWNIDYFIVNQSSRQLLYLSLYAESHLHAHHPSMSGSLDFKEDMELDLEEDSIDDDMAWCDSAEMSPRSELKNMNQRTGSLSNRKKVNQQNESDDITESGSNQSNGTVTGTVPGTFLGTGPKPDHSTSTTTKHEAKVSNMKEIMNNEEDEDSDVMIISDNLDEVRPKKRRHRKRGKKDKKRRLKVISIERVEVNKMPALERPSDMSHMTDM